MNSGRLRMLLARRMRVNHIEWTAAVGLLSQIARPLISIITMPVLLSDLGKEGLGLWLIALSVIGMISFANAGLSTSLVTAIGRASVDASDEMICRLTSCATLIALGSGAAVAAIVLPAALMIDWHWVLNLSSEIKPEDVTRLFVVLMAICTFGFVAYVPRQIMIARLHGYLAYAVDLVGIVAGAGLMLFALHLGKALWVIALAFILPQYLALGILGLVYLRRERIPLLSRAHIDRATLSSLGRESAKFTAYQASYAISSQSDILLVGIVLGAPATAAYGIAQRIFSLPVLFVTAVNQALWPELARADANREDARVARIHSRMLYLGTSAALATALVLAFGYKLLVTLWLGRFVPTDPLILEGMVCWVLVTSLVNTMDTLLRARLETSFIMYGMLAMAIINICTTLALLPIIGPAGAIWGSVTGYAVALLIPYSLKIRGQSGIARREAMVQQTPGSSGE